MPPAMLNLGGRKFVVIPQGEYRQLKAKAARNGKSASAKPTQAKRRLSLQDQGDIAESRRRLASEKRIPLADVARELGFDPATLRR